MAKFAQYKRFADKPVVGEDYDGKQLRGKCTVTECRDLSGDKVLAYTFTVDGRSADPATLKLAKAKVEKKDIPVDRELYSRVKAEAKRKFDVYPSAYANGWLVQEYKRRGGKYRSVSKHADHDQSTHGSWAKSRKAGNPKVFKDRPVPKVGDRIGVHLDLNGRESGLGKRVAFSVKMLNSKGKPKYGKTQAHTTGMVLGDIEVDVNRAGLRGAIRQASKNPHSAFIGTVKEWLDSPQEFKLPAGAVEVDYWVDPKSGKYDETQTGVWYVKDGTYRVFKRASNGVGIGGVKGGDKARTYVWGDIELGEANAYLMKWAESKGLQKAHEIAHKMRVAKHAEHDQSTHGNWAKHSRGQVIGQLGFWTDEPYKRTAPEEYDSRPGKVRDRFPEPRHPPGVGADNDEVAFEIAQDIFDLEITTSDGEVIKSKVVTGFTNQYGDVDVYGEVVLVESDGSATNIGKFHRNIDFGDKSAYNQSFRVGITGEGIGTTLLRHWEDQLARYGIQTMRVDATSGGTMNGAYTWAKYGYYPTMAGTADQLLSEFISYQHEEDLPEIASALYRYTFGYHSADKLYVDLKDAWSKNGNIGYMAYSDDPGSDIRISDAIGEDLLLLIDTVPDFGDYLKSNGSWEGEKGTYKIRKGSELQAEIVAICNRWMEQDPVGLENDDPKFFAELREARAKHRKVKKHAEHDQKAHGSWANESGGAPNVDDAVAAWVGANSGGPIGNDIKAMVTGRESSVPSPYREQARQYATQLQAAIKQAKKTDSQLHRGMTRRPKWEEGDEVNLPLESVTDDWDLARDYAKDFDSYRKPTAMVRFEPGAPYIDGTGYRAGGSEGITGGRFKVTRVEQGMTLRSDVYPVYVLEYVGES